MLKKLDKKHESRELTANMVVSRARVFRDIKLIPEKCRVALITILQAFSQGVQFTDREQTELFFSLTQLFHSSDAYIHRLLILLLQIVPVSSHDSIIVTHSLSKDIIGENNDNKGRAIRCLCNLLEVNNVLALERFLKLSIASDVSYVASAALFGALKIINSGRKDVILKWVAEIMIAAKSNNKAVKAHAFRVMYFLRSDNHHQAGMLSSNIDVLDNFESASIYLMFARNTSKFKQIDTKFGQRIAEILKIDSSCKLEAIRKLPEETRQYSVDILGELLSVDNKVHNFAAVRTIALSKYSHDYISLLPHIIKLMKSSNSSLAALASICVLRLGNESTVDNTARNILKNCKGWPVPLLKIVAEESCKFAAKYKNEKLIDIPILILTISDDQTRLLMLKYLLTTPGIPVSHLLPKLCEHLEDWSSLIVANTICDYIASKAEELEDPSSVVNVFFNRILLDVLPVRLSSLNTLAAIACKCKGMKDKVLPLLTLFLEDDDCYVREFVSLLIQNIQIGNDITLYQVPFILNVREEVQNILEQPKPETSPQGFVVNYIPVEINSAFEKYGQCISRSKVIELQDQDSEFIVSYFINVLQNHIIFEFVITNTIENTTFKNVTIDLSNCQLVEQTSIPSLSYKQTSSVNIVIERSVKFLTRTYKATMIYSNEEDDDEYELGEVVLGISSYMELYETDDFNSLFGDPNLHEKASIFVLAKEKSPISAAKRIESEIIGIERVSEAKLQNKLVINFACRLVETSQIVLINVQIGYSKNKEVMCRVAVRTETDALSKSILESLHF